MVSSTDFWGITAWQENNARAAGMIRKDATFTAKKTEPGAAAFQSNGKQSTTPLWL